MNDLVVVAAALVGETGITLGDLARLALGSRCDGAHRDDSASSADRPSSLTGADDGTLSATTGGNWACGGTRDTGGSKTDEGSASGRRRTLSRRGSRRGSNRRGISAAVTRRGAVASNGCNSSADDLGTGVLEFDGSNPLGDGTAVTGVSTEHGRESIESSLGGLGTTDGNGSTLHVHLSVSKTVEPGPCNDGLASGEVRGNLEAESWERVLAVSGFEIAGSLDRVVSLPRGHDSPSGVLGRIGVISD